MVNCDDNLRELTKFDAKTFTLANCRSLHNHNYDNYDNYDDNANAHNN